MKKILLGLIILITQAFGMSLSQEAKEETNVFNSGVLGKIEVTGRLISEEATIKYVVYASNDGTYDETGDKLVLPDFVVINKENKGGFKEKPKKVYVKKISSDSNSVKDLTNEVVKFRLNLDSAYSYHNMKFFGAGSGTNTISPTAFISKKSLDKVIKRTEIKGISIDGYGDIRIDNLGYRCGKGIEAYSNNNGIFEIRDVNNSYYYVSPITGANSKKIQQAFLQGETVSGVSISVMVD